MGTRLRDMIRSIRACKTAAEERSVVAKESAFLRNAFKENDQDYRHRNVAKLMFIHMLGYPTHFGQMECLKLIASPAFPEKRIGYLGLMILLDERQEVLMLVTNSLKNDLNHSNQFIQGLALCALGNICSAEMARDLAPEVEKLLNKSNSYLRKKAALCAIRIIRKVPDLIEQFTYPASNVLADKHHGVLLCGIKLAIELCQKNQYALEYFRKQTSSIVRILKSLISSGYTPEYDVGGITDPFLQVRILRLLRLVGKGDAEASDIMSDILAQVATNTESSKNSGNSILYECVSTIMAIESIGGLRILAINILGRFLSNKDNNIRYVALNTLVKIVSIDTQAVQRHRKIVVECVKDSDISIRRRALDLLSGLVNESNVKNLTNELLNYLKICDNEFKPDLTAKLCHLIQRFSPTKIWQIDTLIKVMIQAGEFVKEDDVIRPLIVLISNDAQIYGYSARAFYKAFKDWKGQDSLTEIIAWVIGEYGDLLLNPTDYVDGEEKIAVDEHGIIHVFETMLKDVRVSVNCKGLALISLLKLSSRLPSSKEKIKSIILHYKGNVILEIQQRAIEFSLILSRHENIKSALVERMPALDEAAYRAKKADISSLETFKSTSSNASDSASNIKANGSVSSDNASTAKSPSSVLKDLLDLSMDDAPSSSPSLSPSPPVTAHQNLLDLLGDSFSNTSNPPANAAVAPASKQGGGNDMLLDLLSLGDPSSSSSSSASSASSASSMPSSTPLPPSLFSDFPSATSPSIPNPLETSFPSLSPSPSPSSISSDPFSLLTQPSFPSTAPNSVSLSPSSHPFPSLFPSLPHPSLAASPAEPPLFSLSPSPPTTALPASSLPSVTSNDPFANFGFVSSAPAPAPSPPSFPSIVAFEKDGLKIVFDFSKIMEDSKKTIIKASYSNSSSFSLEDFVFQAAVPKFMQLALQPATSNTISPNNGGFVYQELQITNNMHGQKALVMKLRISYRVNGEEVLHQTQVNNFPTGL